ncbi:hypothetical protein HH212_21755 [Massilia forsythiae]|uniref:DUF6531 domain-containing protein n=1 Tax=Massilia forsythiae TaxID=2728020 RepID=A0A7Z2ZU96_9BURK|nr:RHS repeat-associated core domain-containing protein [Massilia forsythiae]QJE02323.1 hypothetical protein HH212_21755 [Massilia forsythiae]
MALSLALPACAPPAGAQTVPLPMPPSCDPRVQPCAPSAAPPGGGMCQPSPGGDTCPAPGPASQGQGAGIDAGAGNPIDIITGNKHQRETDMAALPGVLGLEIVRHYNSVYASPRHANGILGRGWKLSYETALYHTGRSIQIVQADGARLVFSATPDDPSRCAGADPANGIVRIGRGQGGAAYTWRWNDGRELSFDRGGRLVRIAVRTGEAVKLDYTRRGLLARVTDPQGRVLTLDYPAAGGGTFSGVHGIDSPVGRFNYAYGSAAPAGAAIAPAYLAASLVKVGMPPSTSFAAGAGAARLYHYEDARHPTLLTGISIASHGRGAHPTTRRIGTYLYDADGKGILTVRGEPARLQAGPGGKPLVPARLAPGTGIEQVTFDRSVGGQTTIANSLGQRTVYRHAVIGGARRLLEVRGPGCAGCGKTDVRYGYDGNGSLRDVTDLDPQGRPLRTVKTQRDGAGREIRLDVVHYRQGKPGPARWLLRQAYEGDATQPSMVTRPSVVAGKTLVRRLAYNEYGQVARVSESGWAPSPVAGGAPVPIARTVGYGHALIDGHSVLVRIDGPLPNGKTDSPADSDVVRIDYDAGGTRIVGITEPGNVVTAFSREDAALRPTRRRRSDGVRVSQSDAELAADGKLVGLVESGWLLEDGRVVDGSRATRSERYAYDALGNLAVQRSAAGIVTRYLHRDAGRPTHVVAADDSQTVTGYDTEGRKTEETVYGPGGKALLFHAGYRHPQDGQERAGGPASARYLSGRAGSVAEGLVEQVTRPDGSVVRRWFDDFGRVVAVHSPDAGLRTATYRADDRLLSLRDARGVVTRIDTDTAGRVRRVDYGDDRGGHDAALVFRYEGMVLLAAERWEDGRRDNTMRFRTDVWGRVSGKTLQVAGATSSDPVVAMTVASTRDADGRVLSRTLPSGARLRYGYDPSGRVTGIALGDKTLVGKVQARRAAQGVRPDGFDYGNGLHTRSERDWHGTLQRHDSGVSTARFERDAAGAVAAIERHASLVPGTRQAALKIDIGERTEYGHDRDGRLNAERIAERTAGTEHPAIRFDRTGDPAAGDGERVDAAGNLVRHGGRTLAYGPGGELASVGGDGDGGAAIARYRYDADGIRVAKQTRDGAEYYLYEDGRLVAVADAGGRIVAEYVYLEHRPVARLRYVATAAAAGKDAPILSKPVIEYLHADQRGAVEAVTDEHGATVWNARLGAYGGLRMVRGHADAMPLRLAGQYADRETGLHYNVHRYYDPRRGRYLQPDPLGIGGGLNTYAYTDGKPLLAGDPSGLEVDCDDLAAGKCEFAPWLFGILLHTSFNEQIRPRGVGWGADDGRGQTWVGLRPDVYYVDDHNLQLEHLGQAFAGTLWELKPVSWTKGNDAARYRQAEDQLSNYRTQAKKGCWVAGSSSILTAGLRTDEIEFEGRFYRITYVPDTTDDRSGLLFYEKSEIQRKTVADPAQAPAPSMSEAERALLELQMGAVEEDGRRRGWSAGQIAGFLCLVLMAVAAAMFAGMAMIGLLTQIAAVIGAGVSVIAGIAAIFGLGSAADNAAALEKKGEEARSGAIDHVVRWFKSWL